MHRDGSRTIRSGIASGVGKSLSQPLEGKSHQKARTRRDSHHHSIGNHFKSSKIALTTPGEKIAAEGTHKDGTRSIR